MAWGALHGVYLMIERLLGGARRGAERSMGLAQKVALALLTYLAVVVTWVFFRAQDFPTAARLLTSMAGMGPEGVPVLPQIYMLEAALGVSALLLVHLFMADRTLEGLVEKTQGWIVASAWAGMLFALIITQGGGGSFIYFQF